MIMITTFRLNRDSVCVKASLKIHLSMFDLLVDFITNRIFIDLFKFYFRHLVTINISIVLSIQEEPSSKSEKVDFSYFKRKKMYGNIFIKVLEMIEI